MKRALAMLTGTLAIVFLIAVPPAVAREQETGKWAGRLADETVITEAGLREILEEHKLWITSGGAEGRQADLTEANLSGAYLAHADLSGAVLNGADLSGTDLSGIKLKGAGLILADLTGAWMVGVDLSGADLSLSYLASAVFEPEAGTLPDIPSIAHAHDLSMMEYASSPHGLVELREAFKENGLLPQEREITCAIKRTQRIKAKNPAVKFLMLTLFELTCAYGMSPFRPLILIGVFIVAFSLVYMVALKKNSILRFLITLFLSTQRAFWIRKRVGEIWRIWPEDRLSKDGSVEDRERVPAHGLRFVFFGFYFSILSAFNIGWRDLNVGNWISRIQPHEYSLRATGWIRTVSGIQSLISIYLLALFFLTYFGRPFENF